MCVYTWWKTGCHMTGHMVSFLREGVLDGLLSLLLELMEGHAHLLVQPIDTDIRIIVCALYTM